MHDRPFRTDSSGSVVRHRMALTTFVTLAALTCSSAARAESVLPRPEPAFAGATEHTLEHTVPVRFSGYAGLDIGRDNGLSVSPSEIYYLRVPFLFEGTIEQIAFEVD